VMRTPPITLQTGATAFSLFIQPVVKADTGSASVDLYVSDVSVRKVL